MGGERMGHPESYTIGDAADALLAKAWGRHAPVPTSGSMRPVEPVKGPEPHDRIRRPYEHIGAKNTVTLPVLATDGTVTEEQARVADLMGGLGFETRHVIFLRAVATATPLPARAAILREIAQIIHKGLVP